MAVLPGGAEGMAGPYVMRRRFSASTLVAFTQQDMRTPAWFGAAAALTPDERTAAEARGIILQVGIYTDAGTVDLADTAGPGDQFAPTNAAVTITWWQNNYTNRMARTDFFLRTAAADFVVEVFFNIVPADGEYSS